LGEVTIYNRRWMIRGAACVKRASELREVVMVFSTGFRVGAISAEGTKKKGTRSWYKWLFTQCCDQGCDGAIFRALTRDLRIFGLQFCDFGSLNRRRTRE